MRKISFILGLFALGAAQVSQAQTIKSPSGVAYTLKACTRQEGGMVRCTFALQSQYASRPLLNARELTATTSTGVVVEGDHAEASGKLLKYPGAVEIPKGNVEVPFSVYFKYPEAENTITVLTISANQKVIYNNVPIAGAAQVVAGLPGQEGWRKSVKWQNRDYVAMIPGCYATGTTATCYVNLFPSNAKGTVSGEGLTFPATTLQLEKQPVVNGAATVQFGGVTFTGIPVR